MTEQKIGQRCKCGEPSDKATRCFVMKKDGTGELVAQHFYCQGCIDAIQSKLNAAWRRQIDPPQDYRGFLKP